MLCPAASEPVAGVTARSSAWAAGTVTMNDMTGPPLAVSVNDPAGGRSLPGRASITVVGHAVRTPATGGVGDALLVCGTGIVVGTGAVAEAARSGAVPVLPTGTAEGTVAPDLAGMWPGAGGTCSATVGLVVCTPSTDPGLSCARPPRSGTW